MIPKPVIYLLTQGFSKELYTKITDLSHMMAVVNSPAIVYKYLYTVLPPRPDPSCHPAAVETPLTILPPAPLTVFSQVQETDEVSHFVTPYDPVGHHVSVSTVPSYEPTPIAAPVLEPLSQPEPVPKTPEPPVQASEASCGSVPSEGGRVKRKRTRKRASGAMRRHYNHYYV
jgi:hypothetical protein